MQAADPTAGPDESRPPQAAFDSHFGYIRASRHPDGLELLKANKSAFCLLYVIGMRARRSTSTFNRYNLKLREALLGDHKSYDMTEREYRTAKKVLENARLATFRATSKGTIATITSTHVFDANIEQGDDQTDRQPTDKRRANDGQATTNKEDKKHKNEKEEGSAAKTAPTSNKSSELVWLNELKGDPAYTGIDIDREHAKMMRWCKEYKKPATRRRFLRWLNRTDQTLQAAPAANEQPDHSKGF